MKYVIVYTGAAEDRWQVHDIYSQECYRLALAVMSRLRIDNPNRHYEMHPVDERVLSALLSPAAVS